MARRASWRIPIFIKVRFCCCDKGCSGTIANLSECGMFINSHKMCFPGDTEFKLSMPWEDELMHIPVRLVRRAELDNGHSGIGVELLDPTQNIWIL